MKTSLPLFAVGMMISNLSFAVEAPVVVQTRIVSANGLSISLPTDGSHCDPSVIGANLEKLRQARVLQATNLVPTGPILGHCYGACPGDLEKALEQHCRKAEKLAEIVDLLK